MLSELTHTPPFDSNEQARKLAFAMISTLIPTAEAARLNSTTGDFVVPYAQDAYAGWSEAILFLDRHDHIVVFDSEVRALFNSEYLGGNKHLAASYSATEEYKNLFTQYAWLGWKAAFLHITKVREQPQSLEMIHA